MLPIDVASAASLWELAIKRGLGRSELLVDARLLRCGLQDNGYSELPIKSERAVFIDSWPSVHNDQFDRLLVSGQRRGQFAAAGR